MVSTRSVVHRAVGWLTLLVLLAAGWPAAAQRGGSSLQGIQDQIDDLAERVVPVGAVLPFSGPLASVPAGFLACDGSEVLRADFPELFAVIGTLHGAGDGSTTFHLPDYRGRFARGVDAGAGRDPASDARGAMNPGGSTGDNVGTIQSFATAAPGASFLVVSGGSHNHITFEAGEHDHDTNVRDRTFCTGLCVGAGDRDGSPRWLTSIDIATGFAPGHTHSMSGPSQFHSHLVEGGEAETRPVNAAVHWIIRY